jgi:hypothetical protein
MARNNRLNEIRKRRAKATAGSMESDAGNGVVTVAPLPGDEFCRMIGEFALTDKGRFDADFCANCYDDVEWLIEDIEQLEDTVACIEANVRLDYDWGYIKLRNEIESLKRELDSAKEQLGED